MPKRFLHIPKGLLKLAVFLALVGVGLVFALMRTQAGRDYLARQIEAEFNKAFHGSLRIGRLHGNLARTFYATDVSINDPEGRTVIYVDSLVLRLGLLDGLRRNVTIRHAEFLNPRAHLIRDDSLGWNISRAFTPRERDGPPSTKWAFRSADVVVSNASIVARNAGVKPTAVDSLTVFDFTNGRLDGLDIDATIEWSDDYRLIDLRQFAAYLTTQGFEIASLRSQIAITDHSIAINEAELTTSGSHIHASLRLADLDSLEALRNDRFDIPQLVVNIDDADFDSTEIATIFPSVRLPDTQFRLLAGGSSRDLAVEELFIQVGDAYARARGRLQGWPDSVAFAADIEESVISTDLVAERIPQFAELLSRIPNQRLRAAVDGTFEISESGPAALRRTNTAFEITSDLGLVSGEISVARSADDTLRYEGQLVLSEYAAAAWLPGLGQTELNGDLSFGGSGISLGDLRADARLEMRSSIVRGVRFDSLHVMARADHGLLYAELDGLGQEGALSARTSLEMRDDIPDLAAVVRLNAFNLTALTAGTQRPAASNVSATIDLRASGNSFDDVGFTAAVVVDTASFFAGRDTMTLSPSRHRLIVDHADSVSTRFSLTGDVLEGQLYGRFTLNPLVRSTGLWLGAADHTISEQRRKRLHDDDHLFTEDVGEEAFAVGRRELETYLAAAGFDNGLTLNGQLHVKRMRDLNQVWDFIPVSARFAVLSGSAHLSSDSLDLSMSVDADSIRGGGLVMDDLSLRARLSGPFGYSLEEGLSATLHLAVGALESGSQRLEDVELAYVFEDGHASLGVHSSEAANGGLSVSLDAGLNVFPGWNQIDLTDLTIRKGRYVWSTYGETTFRMYGDAITVEELEIRSLHNLGDFDRPEQVFVFDGVLSAHPDDSLGVDARFIRLEEMSELARFQFAIGGEMHAAITVAHALANPRTVGDLSVSALTFDGRDLGDLRIRSVYSSPTEGIAVDMRLTQPRDKTRGVQRFDSHIYGTVRPPSGEPGDRGILNLEVDLAEIDMFFFEYLFPNELADVSGEGSGRGTITGDFGFPVFNASFHIDRSSFLVPEFNLRFGLSGPVTVDRSGFHLHEVVLTDPTGGRGTLRGDILFNDYRFFSFDIAADLTEIMIMNVSRSMDLSFYGQVWVSGSATLTGPLQQTLLRSVDAVTAQKSRLYLPVTEDEIESDKTFIVFADSAGEFQIEQRDNILSRRPQTERAFVEGMDMSFNILIPDESSVFLVFDPLLGDVIHALGSGRVQLQRREGDFQAFGTFTVESGDYLFTAGEVFQRRFTLLNGGTITWDGDPIDARLDIPAIYRTRASLAGLPGQNPEDRIPIRVDMSLTGRVTIPIVDLRIELDRDQRDSQVIPPGLESALNQPDLAVEYATSVLLTNTFLLTSNQGSDALTNTADDLLFHSLSQLVSSQLNRFVSQALNLDVNVGVQQGRTEEDYDVIYGFALRLDDQRVVIRGEGLYETGTNEASAANNGIQGAFVVEYRLTPSVQLEFFFRRESDLYRAASSLGTAYGVGIVYQTSFPNWGQFGRRLRGVKEREILDEQPQGDVPASE